MKEAVRDVRGAAENRAALSALEFDRVADEIFAPIYPVIARRILELAGVSGGLCLDLGCGGGHLGLAAAEFFPGEIILLDSNPWALKLAENRIRESERDRIRVLWADVHTMPIADGAADVVISRGSMWFWDIEESLWEITRVLAPGGAAVIGGGYGNPALKEKIYRTMSALDGEDWGAKRKRKIEGRSPEDYAAALERMGTGNYHVIHDESGDWLLFRK
jgi:SAM-dependent methyltransferase